MRCGTWEEMISFVFCVLFSVSAAISLHASEMVGLHGNICRRCLASRANGFSYKAKFRKGIDRRNKETEINKNLSHTFHFLLFSVMLDKLSSKGTIEVQVLEKKR